MKKLDFNQMEQVIGGKQCTGTANASISVLKDISCGFSFIWPIGTLIAGPSCLGLIAASAICAAG